MNSMMAKIESPDTAKLRHDYHLRIVNYWYADDELIWDMSSLPRLHFLTAPMPPFKLSDTNKLVAVNNKRMLIDGYVQQNTMRFNTKTY